jgi:ABC-type glutathione transport system ATPase component
VVSIGMSIAFECRDLHKRFAVGAGNCGASAQVLRGIDLVLRAGECLAIVGPRGSGKSTLLLCAARLLKPDLGTARWFGEPTPAQPPRRVAYHWTAADFAQASADVDVGIHLVDFAVAADWPSRFASWIESQRQQGSAIMFGTRDESVARALASRTLFLRGGRLYTAARADAASRVAEPVA